MTLPRRAHLTLSAPTMVLLFGLLGLAWWVWRYRISKEHLRGLIGHEAKHRVQWPGPRDGRRARTRRVS